MNPNKLWNVTTWYYREHEPAGARLEKFRAVRVRILDRLAAVRNTRPYCATTNHGRDSFGNPFHETD